MSILGSIVVMAILWELRWIITFLLVAGLAYHLQPEWSQLALAGYYLATFFASFAAGLLAEIGLDG